MYIKYQKNFKRRFFRKKEKNIFFFKKFSKYDSQKYVYTYKILRTTKKSLFFFKKKLKKKFKKKNLFFRINIIPNYNVSFKGKNPRMGGGGGFYTRSVFQSNSLRPIFITNNITSIKLKQILNFFFKKLNKSVFIKK